MEPSDLQLTSLSNHLHTARTFEAAGAVLLRTLFDFASAILFDDESVANSETPEQPAILRGSVHFRPDNEYQRLFCLESPRDPARPGLLTLSSLTAWRWVVQRGCPVTIDVGSRILRVFEGGDPRLFHDAPTAVPLESNETCQRLVAREADFVLALPLRRFGGIVDGMVSLEFQAGSGFEYRLPVLAQARVLQLLVDLAAPHLMGLPCKSSEERPDVDEYLPVVGTSTVRLAELLRVFSGLEETLLLTGPTGVGKSRLARYCHAHSARQGKPFVTLDLLACPESLQMPQLCGSKKGAYTGADRDTPGAIQRADGGTLFIDEIDKLSLPAQAGLLRLLEERVYRPIGASGDDRLANVRFIVGTSTNLRDAVQAGKFREDLYYRIAVLMVRVPPLARRRDEIPGWAEFMLTRCHQSARGCQANGEFHLAADALALLTSQPWPGNLRQLDNVMRRAYAYGLVDCGHYVTSIVVSSEHVARAIRDDSDVSPESQASSPVVDAMQTAARAFAEEVKRRAVTAEPLHFEWADAFRAMVLDATIALCDNDKEEALLALGLSSLVRDRNHHRMIKREMEFLQRFFATVPSGAENESDAIGTREHPSHLGGAPV